jgi:methanogenic corrinoid protein MtbC1
MSTLGSSTLRGGPAAAAADETGATWLSTLVYSSRAVAPMSEPELYQLRQEASARNRAESITGMLIYDNGRFFQWLEGPAEALARVWASIRDDARHTDIEVVGEQRTPVRFFGDWDLKLAKRPARTQDAGRPMLDPVDDHYRRPKPLAHTGEAGGAFEGAAVVPHLVASQGFTRHRFGFAPAADPCVAELAGLLTAADPEAAFELIEDLQARAGSVTALYGSLFEPVARVLGDRWGADDCSEFEVTLGLCRLQTAARRTGAGPRARQRAGLPVRAVLVVPQPGEHHTLGAALDSELLWQAGWDAHCDYLASDEDLQAVLAGAWFDALDLSLSAAFRREHWLSRMARTIAQARAASRNPALVVVVGGRVFVEQADAVARVGADAGARSSMQVEQCVQRVLRRRS